MHLQGVPLLGSKTYLAEPLMTYRGQTVVSVTKVTSQTNFFGRIDQGYFSELTSCTVYKHQSRVAFICLIFMIKSFAVCPSQDTYVLTKLHNIKVTFEERKWTNRITRIYLIVYEATHHDVYSYKQSALAIKFYFHISKNMKNELWN